MEDAGEGLQVFHRVAQMHEVLKARGIEIGERSLKAFIDKGELPGRKTAKSVANATASTEGGDPF